jgi:AraC family transcriptional regulator of adaptative response / DNA-3-methyladenine glycosylase II
MKDPHHPPLSLPYRPPFDWTTISGFLGARAIPGVEVVEGDSYRRIIRVEGETGAIELQHRPDEPCLLLRLWLPSDAPVLQIAERARRIFDLDADPTQIAAQLRQTPLFSAYKAGMRVPGAWDGFEISVRAVLGQQVSVAAARTLASRFAAAFGTPIESPFAELTTVFPSAEDIAICAPEEITRLGILPKRAATILEIARLLAEGRLRLTPAADPLATIETLKTIPGIGDWTAHYIAMRALAWADAFPHSDLGVMKALGERNPKRVLALGEAWRPWRAYAVMHLWQKSD